MNDAASPTPAIETPLGRRLAIRLLALLALAPALAACKTAEPGSGLDTIRSRQRHDGGPGGN